MNKTSIAVAVLAAYSIAAQVAHADHDDNEIITVIGNPLQHISNARVSSSSNTEADFGDQLSNIAGISVSRNGPVTGLIQYRGLFGDRVGVSVDGVDIQGAGPNAMDSPLSHVLPELGMQATLYRGIAPVSAGIQSLGGQLVMQSDMTMLFSQPNGLQLSGNAALISPGEGAQYQVNAFYGFDDGFATGAFTHQQRDKREAGDGTLIPNTNYQRNGVKLGGGFTTGKHSVEVRYQQLDTNESGTAALAMDIKFIDAAWYRLGYRYQQSDNHYLTVNWFGNSNQHTMDNFSQRLLMMASMARQNDTDSLMQGGDITYVTPLMDGELTAGLAHKHLGNNSIISNPNNAMFFVNNFMNVEQDTNSGFVEWQGTVGQAAVTMGSRLTQISSNADDVNSSMVMMSDAVSMLVNAFNSADRDQSDTMVDIAITAQFELSEHNSVFAGVSQKNRAPNYFERYTWLPLAISGGMADGFTYIGDVNLTHETAHQVELGFTYTTEHWTFSPRLFYQDVSDYIAGTPTTNTAATMVAGMMGASTPFQWTNTDATLKGFDAQLSGAITDNVNLNAVASYVHGTRNDIDDALFRITPFTLVSHINWRTRMGSIPLTLQATSELVASQNHVSALQNESKSAGYGLVHLSADWELGHQWTFTAQIRNLFDKNYVPHTAGINRVSGVSVPVGEKLPGTGTVWKLSASYQF